MEGIMTNPQMTTAETSVQVSAGKMTSVIVSAMIGFFLIYGVGFAQPNALHNAAHDSRHSLVFPCH